MTMAERDYTVIIHPNAPEGGGGFVPLAPDLPGCMSNGETREEAARNASDTIRAWIDEAIHLGRAVPAPTQHVA
ncbi:MAG: type II toxin-antitoxin system HicB family antitoxin [Rhodospirillales bacterium]|nr:type II toxin-antitoxin system HicB family antitoxin [Rhodospirillales bacterium]